MELQGINQEQLNEINKLRVELDECKAEVESLKSHLSSVFPEQFTIKNLQDRKSHKSFMGKEAHQYGKVLSKSNCFAELLSKKEQAAKRIETLVHCFHEHFSAITEAVNNRLIQFNDTLNKFGIAHDKIVSKISPSSLDGMSVEGLQKENRKLVKQIGESESKSAAAIARWRQQYQKQVHNVKKSICECRRLQAAVNSLQTENSTLKRYMERSEVSVLKDSIDKLSINA